MRLQRLIMTGFGRFQNRTLDLGPGLNVIYGHNEAGKTTIQKFILGMLYGFKKRSARRDYTEDAARYRPWTGEEYRGALIYTVDRTGRSYRAERQFDPRREEVRVFDALTGADVSGRFPMDRRKELLYADEHLGVPEEVFRSTAWVGQMEVGKLEMGRELVERVANMQDSGREDLSVKNALRVLEERAREIGTERAPTKPYARVSRHIEEKRAEIERAAQARRQTMAYEAQLTEVRAVLSELDSELAELNRRLEATALREADERLERITASTAGIREARRRAGELARYAEFPVHLRDRLIRSLGELSAARRQAERYQVRLEELARAQKAVTDQLEGYAGMAAHADDAVRAIEWADQAARAALSQLPQLREEASRLAEVVARANEAMEPFQGAAEKGASVLARVEAIEKELAALHPRMEQQAVDGARMEVSRLEKQAGSAGGWAWAAAAVLLLGAAATSPALLGRPGWPFPVPVLLEMPTAAIPSAAGLGVLGAGALAAYWSARRKRKKLRASLQEAKANLSAMQQRQGQNQERILALERQRERALAAVGASSVNDIRNRVVRYEQLSARRDGQQVRLDAVNAEIRRLQTEQAERRQELHRTLAAAMGISVASLETYPDPTAAFRTAHAAYRELKAQLEGFRREAADVTVRLREAGEQADLHAAEVRAILSEAGVDDAERFEQGCSLRESHRKALAEAEALEGALSSLLGGETTESLQAKVDELRQRVRAPLPADPGGTASLQAEIRKMEARRSELNARASDLSARVETALKDAPDAADLQRELEALLEERQGYAEELAAIELARRTIEEVSAEIHREFAPRLNRAMGERVSSLTGGRYRTVRIDDDMAIRVVTEDERTVDLLSLSGGTIDQFYFALRVALLDLITEGQERIPLLLDDPFVQYDERRLLSSMEYLGALSRERQVVLMTCHEREVRAARALVDGVTVLDISEASEASGGQRPRMPLLEAAPGEEGGA